MNKIFIAIFILLISLVGFFGYARLTCSIIYEEAITAYDDFLPDGSIEGFEIEECELKWWFMGKLEKVQEYF